MKILLLLFQVCIMASAVAQPDQKNKPIWQTSSPEEQGMSSTDLNLMFDYIKEYKPRVHSIQVLRHGHLILDAYFYPYTGETKKMNFLTSITSKILLDFCLKSLLVWPH